MTDKITYLRDWKQKKKQEEHLAEGRTPLYVSHKNGKITGSAHPTKHREDLGTRVARIRTSLEKINRLMVELKNMSKEGTNEK